MKQLSSLLCLLSVFCCSQVGWAEEYDLVVYGGTSAGVISAVQAKRMGKTVVVVGPDKHLGGLSAGGLGFTDTGNKAVIGGLAREFYHRVWKHYDTDAAWKWQKKSEYGGKGQGTPAIDGAERTQWIFEPHVAEQVFEDFVKDDQIPVHRNEWLDREKGVKLVDGRIVSITMLSGKTYSGKMFIDATYEGDLLAAAKCDYHVGREAQSVYDEKWNGIQVGVLHHRHHFGAVKTPISPFVIPGDKTSGVLPRVSTAPVGEYGAGDKRVQAYCYRTCMTKHDPNRVPFPQPEGYDAKQYELLLRVFEAGWREAIDKFDPIPNHKTDTNNHGPFSFDNIGMNYDYPEATYARRQEILKEHTTYQQGLLYFSANDPRVPEDVRNVISKWGLAKDEFVDNGNWPHQIYVREARRLIGSFVMTENELLQKQPTPDSVGMGSYTIDSHNIQRYITPDGFVQNEGDIGVGTKGPYEIAYGSLVPKPGQCGNLLVPVCVSSSHIAFGSIRMEPVFMILGQSAATAAVMAIDAKQSVQEVPYAKLREQLLKDGQILKYASPPGAISEDDSHKSVLPKDLPGVVIDDESATLTGDWTRSNSNGKFVANGYQHDGNTHDGQFKARFETKLPKPGTYEVRLSYSPNGNRATNVPVKIIFSKGTATVRINQQITPSIDGLSMSLGQFEFTADQPAVVELTNTGTDGYVIADAVQWIEVK